MMLANQFRDFNFCQKLHKSIHASKREGGHTAADHSGRTAAAKGHNQNYKKDSDRQNDSRKKQNSELLPTQSMQWQTPVIVHNNRKRGWRNPDTVVARKLRSCARRRINRRLRTIQKEKSSAKVDGVDKDPAHQPDFCRSQEAEAAQNDTSKQEIKWQKLAEQEDKFCENPKRKECKKVRKVLNHNKNIQTQLGWQHSIYMAQTW